MFMEKKLFTFDEIKLKMVNYCTYQDRCHQEVEQKMREFMLIPEAKDEILLYLMRENFLNEERFARSYVRGKFYHKSWGRKKIANHLKFKGVSEKLINMAMMEIDEEEYLDVLNKLTEKYINSLKSGTDFEKKQRAVRYLLGKGYESDVVQVSVNQYFNGGGVVLYNENK
ncbi:RecX family transcriptional regulator [Riemerella anatipestifer]|nr:regulatory protein RecX [Riemerella anatipestifer]MBT0573056.1 RecX family transcriptional regulator [Riemerella anatipestifer]MCW0509996.1 RecX family transcriptional regulator [Riemerella anatipestifer]MDD1553723.1 RecX family transcriptional regulator [Riemerella anatipestifer]MDY3377542.1 regulatory protein RecX [Riemerella anatipestifer]MDY3438822.1 regulatory protein RecX [Riemerella anatipestifer]